MRFAKIALTGSTGIVGKGVLEVALEQGYHVVCIDRAPPAEPHPNTDKVEFRQADATNYEAIVEAMRGCDALIHLAALPNPSLAPDHITHNNNVVSSYNVLRGAVDVGIKRVVQSSSVNVIGFAWSQKVHLDYLPVDESHPTYTDDAYSLSKFISEQQAANLCRRYHDLRIASLRMSWSNDLETILSHRDHPGSAKDLWGWVSLRAAAKCCILGLTSEGWTGHESFFCCAPTPAIHADEEQDVVKLAVKYYPKATIRPSLLELGTFFDVRKAERLLGWVGDDDAE